MNIRFTHNPDYPITFTLDIRLTERQIAQLKACQAAGKPIDAIKAIRDHFNCDLKSAKQIWEFVRDQHSDPVGGGFAGLEHLA